MTNKLKYFIGNWKMFGDFGSFKIINKIYKFSQNTKKKYKIKIIFCIPSTLISSFKKKIKKKFLFFGAQNCHYFDNYGPYTGSINANMLKKVGANYIIIGHSENRAEGETNQLIKKKIISALKSNLNIIFCIGENLKDNKKGKTFNVLKNQIKGSLEKKMKINKIIFAYEPVWSIGTNKIPKTKDLIKITRFIKKVVKKSFKTKNDPIVLYGGSVNDKNISLFSTINEIDGFLIGGASQSSKKFIDIIKNYFK